MTTINPESRRVIENNDNNDIINEESIGRIFSRSVQGVQKNVERVNLMDAQLKMKYCKRFVCKLATAYQNWTLTLATADGKLYDLDDATDEELNALMQESLDKDENVLLERVKDKEYTFEPDPDCDY